MPYVVLTILLIRGLMLPGAISGISYYLQPELTKLRETQVKDYNNNYPHNILMSSLMLILLFRFGWMLQCRFFTLLVQVLGYICLMPVIILSIITATGEPLRGWFIICFQFLLKIRRDCIITTIVNCFTSFFSGFVIFTYLGYMSYKQGVPISAVATEGQFKVLRFSLINLNQNIFDLIFFNLIMTCRTWFGISSLPRSSSYSAWFSFVVHFILLHVDNGGT